MVGHPIHLIQVVAKLTLPQAYPELLFEEKYVDIGKLNPES